MEIQIIKDSENKLLGRKEISFSLSYSGKTPTKDEVKQELCKKLSINPELMLVIRITPLFGTTVSEGLAHAYTSKEMMGVEHSYIAERSNKKAKKGAAEAPQAQVEEPKKEEKAEAKKEESKEEKPKE